MIYIVGYSQEMFFWPFLFETQFFLQWMGCAALHPPHIHMQVRIQVASHRIFSAEKFCPAK